MTYKLHVVYSLNGVISSFDISKTFVRDIYYLQDIKQQVSDCVLLADKGYLSAKIILDLFEDANIKLETPMKIKKYKNNY